jgi:uncharacterized membrane protein YfcA
MSSPAPALFATVAIGAGMREIDAARNFLSAIICSTTVSTFVIADAVSSPYTIIMLATATLGGYWEASMAQEIPAPRLRRFIHGGRFQTGCIPFL